MTQFVEVQGETLAAVLFEPAGARKADVVLVHGFTGSKEDFSEVAPLIANSGFRVLTFDNRGQNESSHTKRDDGYTMPSLARDVIEISQRFQLQRPHLLGHSFGGLIAQQATKLSPESWSSLTLMCSGPGGRTDWLDEPQFKNLTNETKGEIWEKVLEQDRIGNIQFELLRKRWLASDAVSTMTFRDHLLKQQSVITEIAKLGITSHVIYGENDDAWPIEEQNSMALELGARLTVLPGCGHCPNEENPTLLANELIDFWNLG
jgi:pimeloyl-ACP methyl ester carboxylesterase